MAMTRNDVYELCEGLKSATLSLIAKKNTLIDMTDSFTFASPTEAEAMRFTNLFMEILVLTKDIDEMNRMLEEYDDDDYQSTIASYTGRDI